MKPAAAVTLLVTTCEGRSRLLRKTLDSFHAACDFPFAARIVAADGVVDGSVLEMARPDVVVHSPVRRGYVRSLLAVMRHIETSYFFWLEDDWRFPRPVDVPALATLIDAHPELAQMRLSGTAPLDGERCEVLAPDVLRSPSGFSANPSLCRAASVRGAFDALRSGPRDPREGFEQFVDGWLTSHGYVCAVLDPGDAPAVEHIGALESTPRQWHMTASVDRTPVEHLLALGTPPPFWRRVYMLGKLARKLVVLGGRQLWSDAAYETAFRVAVLPVDDDGRS